jgi:hypothetical protein
MFLYVFDVQFLLMIACHVANSRGIFVQHPLQQFLPRFHEQGHSHQPLQPPLHFECYCKTIFCVSSVLVGINFEFPIWVVLMTDPHPVT